MTVAEALRRAISQLRAAGVDQPELDARVLLAHALGVPRGRLTILLHDPLTDEVKGKLNHVVSRRCSREPVSHILGGRLFFDRWFRVTPDVLDPRPETETLVTAALERSFFRVLDLGTGSGAILLTLLAERPDATGTGTDLSGAALAVARQNADALGLSDRADLIQSDWYAALEGGYDLIVSNPPYIAADEMAGLAPDVKDHEPRMALTDEADGLTAYRAIATGSLRHLVPGGWLLVEIGPTQGAAVRQIFVDAGLGEITLRQDFDGRDRVVLAQAPLETGDEKTDL